MEAQAGDGACVSLGCPLPPSHSHLQPTSSIVPLWWVSFSSLTRPVFFLCLVCTPPLHAATCCVCCTNKQAVVAFANFERRVSGPQAAAAVYQQALKQQQQQQQQEGKHDSKDSSSGSSVSSSRGFLYVVYANFLRQVGSGVCSAMIVLVGGDSAACALLRMRLLQVQRLPVCQTLGLPRCCSSLLLYLT